MINIPPIKTSSPITPDLITDVSKSWRAGQVLNATTQQGGEALSKVLIRLGQHTLEARTPVALQTGQDIKLLVKSLGDGAKSPPLLSILEQLPSKPLDGSSLTAAKLRQFIAVQQSFTQAHQIAQSLLANKEMAQSLPSALKNNLIKLQDSLILNDKKLNTAQLKESISNSGIFLESKLLNLSTSRSTSISAQNTLMNDFKNQLLSIRSELSQLTGAQQQNLLEMKPLTPQQLKQLHTFIMDNRNNISAISGKLLSSLPKTALIQLSTLLTKPGTLTTSADELLNLTQTLSKILQQQAQPQIILQRLQQQINFRIMLLELSQQIDQSVSKLTSFQLQPLSREGDNLVLLLFNLVFKDSHEHFDMNFRIQQENRNNDQNKENWHVTLSFNFKTLGKVQSLIHLVDDQVSTAFHTELASTTVKIQKLLPLLGSALLNAGLSIVNLSVKNELVSEKPDINNHINLLDENI